MTQPTNYKERVSEILNELAMLHIGKNRDLLDKANVYANAEQAILDLMQELCEEVFDANKEEVFTLNDPECGVFVSEAIKRFEKNQRIKLKQLLSLGS